MTMSIEDKGSKTTGSNNLNNNNNNNNNTTKHHRMIQNIKTEAGDHFSGQSHLESANWHGTNGSGLPPLPPHPSHGRWDDGPPAYSPLVKVKERTVKIDYNNYFTVETA
jgi:hypothetical protein